MGRNTRIEWATHTFNMWQGCHKVSTGCKNCYAETMNQRWKNGENWGLEAPRWYMRDEYWHQLEIWNRAAGEAGRRELVFVNSQSDVFERHPVALEHMEQDNRRLRLYEEILRCENLIFLLLTKRPENVVDMVPPGWGAVGWPENVMLMTSIENQEVAPARLRALLATGAQMHGLSMEPLLGPVEFAEMLREVTCQACGFYGLQLDLEPGDDCPHCKHGMHLVWGDYYRDAIDWVIVGGESGHGARPMHPEWARDLRAQCEALEAPFFFKQWGHWLPVDQLEYNHEARMKATRTGGEFVGVGKSLAGRLLDGEQYDAAPFDLTVKREEAL